MKNTEAETFIPNIKTTTPGNSRRSFWVEAKEAKNARTKTKLLCKTLALPPLPAEITLTRHSVGTCDRHNLGGTLKHVIDGIADAYGIDDADPRYHFIFLQQKVKKSDPKGVHIHIKSI